MHKQLEALADELGSVAGQIEREIRQTLSAALSDAKAKVTEFELRLVRLEQDTRERLASLQNGKDGERGLPGERGEDGKEGKQGPQGESGLDGEDGQDGKQGPQGLPGQDGAPGERGEKGEPGPVGPAGPVGLQGERGLDGKQGERGLEGPRGKLPVLTAWIDGVYYWGDVVAHKGSTYQATKDTAKEPPHSDWVALAVRGADAYAGEVRGLFDPSADYRARDVVTFNDSEWRAVMDNPGPLPGDGWRKGAGKGKPGKPGEMGPRGLKGDQGPPGREIIGWERDLENYRAIPVLSDGTHGEPLEVRPFLERLITERGL